MKFILLALACLLSTQAFAMGRKPANDKAFIFYKASKKSVWETGPRPSPYTDKLCFKGEVKESRADLGALIKQGYIYYPGMRVFPSTVTDGDHGGSVSLELKVYSHWPDNEEGGVFYVDISRCPF